MSWNKSSNIKSMFIIIHRAGCDPKNGPSSGYYRRIGTYSRTPLIRIRLGHSGKSVKNSTKLILTLRRHHGRSPQAYVNQ